MAQPFSVRCPNCEARLKIQNPKAVGKKVRCPNCENPFTVRPPRAAAPPQDDFDLEDDYDEFGDSYDDYEDYAAGDDYGPPRRSSRRGAGGRPPRPGGRGARGGKKRSKKKSANNQVALIVGGIAMAFLLLVGLGFFLYQLAGGGGAKVDYAWLPPDSEIIVSVDVDEVWNSNLANRILNHDEARNLKSELEENLKKVGFQEGESLDAIDSITVGGRQKGDDDFIMVARKKSAWNIDRLISEPGVEEKTHDGTTYYTKDNFALFVPESNTVVFGPEDMLKEAISRGPKSNVTEKFSFLPKGQIVFGFVPDDLQDLRSNISKPPPMPMLQGKKYLADITNTIQKVEGVAFAANLGSGFDMEVLYKLPSSGDAGTLASGMRQGLDDLQTFINDNRGNIDRMGPAFKDFAEIGEEVLRTVSPSSSGEVATVSMEISSGVIDRLEQLGKDMPRGGMPFPKPSLPKFDLGKLFGNLGGGNRGGGVGNPIANAREAARRAQDKNHLKQIGVAMHHYHDVHGSLPVAKNPQNPAGSGLSWRVHLLPFLEQAPLYQQFKLNEPWNSPHNMRLVNQMPDLYRRPGSTAGPGKTNYLGIDGPGGVMENGGGTKFRDISDGLSNTALLVEVEDQAAVTWTQPEDYRYNRIDPKRNLGGWDGGFHVLFCDGAVMLISEHFNPQEMLKMFQMNDGQRLNL